MQLLLNCFITGINGLAASGSFKDMLRIVSRVISVRKSTIVARSEALARSDSHSQLSGLNLAGRQDTMPTPHEAHPQRAHLAGFPSMKS